MNDERILSGELLEEDKVYNIRPETLDEYIGQLKPKKTLEYLLNLPLCEEKA